MAEIEQNAMKICKSIFWTVFAKNVWDKEFPNGKFFRRKYGRLLGDLVVISCMDYTVPKI